MTTSTSASTAGRPKRLRRRVLMGMAAILVVLAGYTTWANLRSHTLTASIDIEATPDEVWSVLTDLDSYPQWNPFIVSSSGDLTAGATLTNTMRGVDGTNTVFTPTVLVARDGRELRWIGKVEPGLLFDGEHSFVLEDLGNSRTRLTQSEEFTGALVPLMQGWLNDDILSQFHAMNQALAARVAQLQGGPA